MGDGLILQRADEARSFGARAVLFIASMSVIVGSFMYGRLIAGYYRDTIEVTAAAIYEDFAEIIEEGKEYLYGALGLAENPE